MTIDDIYSSVATIIVQSKECGYDDIAIRLDDALHRGSSGLEILGAIRNVFVEERRKISKLIGNDRVQEIIGFIEFNYGMK